MQRRAATVYTVLFLVIAAGAYSLIGVAQQPGIQVDGQRYAENESLTVGDRSYTIQSVGGGEATLAWTNESATYTATWENNTTVRWDDTTFRVGIPNTSDPGEVTLREEFNVTENVTTVEEDGTTYVVVDRGGNRTLVPIEEYERQQFGEPEVRRFSEGQTFQYRGNETTVRNVTAEAAALAWTAPRTNTESVGEGGNVTLGPAGDNRTFVAHFPAEGELVLSADTTGYQRQVDEINDFNERIAGLWGVVILSALAVVLLVAFAFLPNK